MARISPPNDRVAEALRLLADDPSPAAVATRKILVDRVHRLQQGAEFVRNRREAQRVGRTHSTSTRLVNKAGLPKSASKRIAWQRTLFGLFERDAVKQAIPSALYDAIFAVLRAQQMWDQADSSAANDPRLFDAMDRALEKLTSFVKLTEKEGRSKLASENAKKGKKNPPPSERVSLMEKWKKSGMARAAAVTRLAKLLGVSLVTARKTAKEVDWTPPNKKRKAG